MFGSYHIASHAVLAYDYINNIPAAHCVQQKKSNKILKPNDIVVLLGKHNLTKIETGSAQRDVDQIFIHPDWNALGEKYDADVAILSLTDPVDFSNLIQAIYMPHVDELTNDSEATIVGWGLAEHTDPNRHEYIPRETTTSVLNTSYCSTVSPKLATFASTRAFCGGGEGGSPNSGDSGGGLFIRSGLAWIQYGIISASLTDALGRRLPNSFSLYTSVAAHINWIIDTVKESGGAVLPKRNQKLRNIDIECEYSIDSRFYRCTVNTAEITKENLRVSNFQGQHLTNRSAENVTLIWFSNGTLNYFPDGIGKLFKNLEAITVSGSNRNLKLKVMQRRSFVDIPHLRYLVVYYNKIELVDEDCLRDLPNLEVFLINNNKLKRLYKNTFARNPKLNWIDAGSNDLEVLDKDLFKNNPLLVYVLFKDNKLTKISPDFTNYNRLKEIDLRGNVCMDSAFKADVLNITDYQALLTSRCSIIKMDLFARM